jgi:hypothetical protein
MPGHRVRAPEALWKAAQDKAEMEFGKRQYPWLIRTLLTAYVNGDLVVDKEGNVSVASPEEGESDGSSAPPTPDLE